MENDLPVQKAIQKLEYCQKIRDEIYILCERYILTEDSNILRDIENRFADFLNNLRSAMNYVARYIFARHLLLSLPAEKVEKINLDFPYKDTKQGFDDLSVIKELRKLGETGEKIYQAFEQVQPYQPGYEWISQLMALSNTDKHEISVAPTTLPITDYSIVKKNRGEISKPTFAGDKLVFQDGNRLKAVSLPCYVSPPGAFATPSHTWVLFLIKSKIETMPNLIEFTIRSLAQMSLGLENLVKQFGGTSTHPQDASSDPKATNL